MAVLAAYRDDPTVTVRDLAARFGVGKSTIALWLKEAGLSRERGARKGAPMANRLVVEDDFKAVLLGWYGAGIERHALTVLNQRRADRLRQCRGLDHWLGAGLCHQQPLSRRAH